MPLLNTQIQNNKTNLLPFHHDFPALRQNIDVMPRVSPQSEGDMKKAGSGSSKRIIRLDELATMAKTYEANSVHREPRERPTAATPLRRGPSLSEGTLQRASQRPKEQPQRPKPNSFKLGSILEEGTMSSNQTHYAEKPREVTLHSQHGWYNQLQTQPEPKASRFPFHISRSTLFGAGLPLFGVAVIAGVVAKSALT
ncbi:MAG TPA: hypothetical protein DHW71_15910 [Gammaproteobacteria bacterium]|nr:hypothetical protein [Gammaproteobacteria bacterium]HBF08196.1 hypothetical protein [Gammaproteobacteria bacterium]HCK94480.1 hypothetical protein [Gammaproteobacteria bacterium]